VRDAAAATEELRHLEASLEGMPMGAAAHGFEDVPYGGKRSDVHADRAANVGPSWLLDGMSRS
jgi:hypothetical protein